MTKKFRSLFLLTIITTSLAHAAAPQKVEVQETEPQSTESQQAEHNHKYSTNQKVMSAACSFSAVWISIILFSWRNQCKQQAEELVRASDRLKQIATQIQELNTLLRKSHL